MPNLLSWLFAYFIIYILSQMKKRCSCVLVVRTYEKAFSKLNDVEIDVSYNQPKSSICSKIKIRFQLDIHFPPNPALLDT